jgi:hypothetical protein
MKRSVLLATLAATLVAAATVMLAPPASAGRPQNTALGLVTGHSSSAPLPDRPNGGGVDASSGAGAHPRADPSTPSKLQQWTGIFDTRGTPGDATGAVGPSTMVEMVNTKIGLYLRSGLLVSSQDLSPFLGLTRTHCLMQPQIHWDPYTSAYYFAMADRGVALPGGDCPVGQETLWYGWSTTSSPSSLSSVDWCALHFDGYAAKAEIPDSPKLGDTKDFGLIGVNVFGPDTNPSLPFLRSDVIAFPKPAPGHTSSCPASQTLYTFPNLSDQGDWSGAPDGAGVPAFAPVPVVQTDPSSTGYIVSADFNGSSNPPYFGYLPAGGPFLGDAISVFTVTLGGGGAPQVSAPTNIPVTSFLWPTNALQKGSSLRLDTQEGQLTQAMSGVDPVHATPSSEAGAIWVQHTVRGGAGAMVRWYELDPTAGSGNQVLQTGTLFNPSMWLYNAAISSDRQVVADGTGTVTDANYGNGMVIGYNVSGTASWVMVKMVSKIGNNLRSGSVLVKTSGGANDDYSCHHSPNHLLCRWGDYAGAAADPYPSITGHGHVWLVNEWVTRSTSPSNFDWRTFVWRVNP